MTDNHLNLAPGAEFDLIRRFLPHAPRLGREDVRVGPGDDCAVVTGDGIAVSVDLSVEDVHFRREWLTPREVGCRAASAALSDLAAVAARPIGLLCALAVAEEETDDLAMDVMDGVREAADRSGCVVLGGDLTRSPGPIIIDVTVLGECPAPVLRSGATPGDEIWVTGRLGAASVTVARLLRGEIPHREAEEAFACPIPRIREARWLAERKLPSAMIDLSDGLAGDAAHISSASGVSLVLERDAIPVHPAVRTETADDGDALRYAVAGGEDYELCFTAAPGALEAHAAAFAAEFDLPLTRVGVVEEGAGVSWRRSDGGVEPLDLHGFQHFSAP